MIHLQSTPRVVCEPSPSVILPELFPDSGQGQEAWSQSTPPFLHKHVMSAVGSAFVNETFRFKMLTRNSNIPKMQFKCSFIH
jgi:hypothetical protein